MVGFGKIASLICYYQADHFDVCVGFQVSYIFKNPEVSDIVIFKVPPILQVCPELVNCIISRTDSVIRVTLSQHTNLSIWCSLQDIGFSSSDIFIKRIVAKAGDYVAVSAHVWEVIL